MSDEPEEIDWAVLRPALANMAEVLWTYFASLVAAGFEQSQAMELAISQQQTMWTSYLK